MSKTITTVSCHVDDKQTIKDVQSRYNFTCDYEAVRLIVGVFLEVEKKYEIKIT